MVLNASAAGSITPPCRTASTDAGPGTAYLCDAAFFENRYTEQELTALVEGA